MGNCITLYQFPSPGYFIKNNIIMNGIKTKFLFLLLVVIFSSISGFSQGPLNDFEYDKEDLNIILKELGFITFKVPIKQNKNQIVDFIFEEYVNGILVNQKSLITEAKFKFEKAGVDWWKKYFVAVKDSIYYSRFYFIKRDSSVTLRLKTHGYSSNENITTLGSALFDCRMIDSTKLEIDKYGSLSVKEDGDVLFLYANKKNIKDPLWCPSGLPKSEVIKRFEYVLYVRTKSYNN